MRHASNRASTRPVVAALTATVALLVTTLAAGAGYALWQRQIDLGAELRVGVAHFAVGLPTADQSPLPVPYKEDFALPGFRIGTPGQPITAGASFTQAVQVDGLTQGNRGMTYSLKSVAIEDPEDAGYLAAASTVAIYPGNCNLETLAPELPLYSGPLADAKFGPIPLAGRDTDPAAITYLCLRFTIPEPPDATYVNTATASANAADDGGPGVAVSATDTWHATVIPPPGAFTPDVTFSFSHQTYRAGAE